MVKKNEFHAGPIIPGDKSGPWCDECGNYVYNPNGWILNPEIAGKLLAIRNKFMNECSSRHQKFISAVDRLKAQA